MTSVVQAWLAEKCSWKEQTVVLCALRGTDTRGSPELKAITRWIRRVALYNAAPNKTFMKDEGFPSIREIVETTPLILDMLPVHYLGHLMHALQVIGCHHFHFEASMLAAQGYLDLCEYLHVNPETETQMTKRLEDELYD